ncbi:hypothetical protein HBB16_17710 [Pseudonocardia sp. MCCB 268]|nr:hypothetical protein [Pseudonocardia cytotoxica]
MRWVGHLPIRTRSRRRQHRARRRHRQWCLLAVLLDAVIVAEEFGRTAGDRGRGVLPVHPRHWRPGRGDRRDRVRPAAPRAPRSPVRRPARRLAGRRRRGRTGRRLGGPWAEVEAGAGAGPPGRDRRRDRGAGLDLRRPERPGGLPPPGWSAPWSPGPRGGSASSEGGAPWVSRGSGGTAPGWARTCRARRTTAAGRARPVRRRRRAPPDAARRVRPAAPGARPRHRRSTCPRSARLPGVVAFDAADLALKHHRAAGPAAGGVHADVDACPGPGQGPLRPATPRGGRRGDRYVRGGDGVEAALVD